MSKTIVFANFVCVCMCVRGWVIVRSILYCVYYERKILVKALLILLCKYKYSKDTFLY